MQLQVIRLGSTVNGTLRLPGSEGLHFPADGLFQLLLPELDKWFPIDEEGGRSLNADGLHVSDVLVQDRNRAGQHAVGLALGDIEADSTGGPPGKVEVGAYMMRQNEDRQAILFSPAVLGGFLGGLAFMYVTAALIKI